MYTIHALKCVHLQVNNTDFEMLMHITHAVPCVRFTLIYYFLRCLPYVYNSRTTNERYS